MIKNKYLKYLIIFVIIIILFYIINTYFFTNKEYFYNVSELPTINDEDINKIKERKVKLKIEIELKKVKSGLLKNNYYGNTLISAFIIEDEENQISDIILTKLSEQRY